MEDWPLDLFCAAAYSEIVDQIGGVEAAEKAILQAMNPVTYAVTDGGGAVLDPETWGTSPQARANQDAMLRMAGAYGMIQEPPRDRDGDEDG